MKEKDFYLKGKLKNLLTDWQEAEGCIATDEIMVKGRKVGYCYRELPDDDSKFGGFDSGWRFTAGDESDDYMDNPENSGIYELNSICNYDPDIIPLLNAPYGTAFFRNKNGIFEQEDFQPPTE
ncbi:Protein of uncharacterised function (DUF2185) [Kingella potus]|uniref:Protein of uncharacterized function (DUF2185) n=1 Tax=Kingella potus TaxID=265175 RepID=A0A377QZI0_9NEIS|nr:DUF2185 domain-containing protein [Kingella potus]UOP00776.1 DUF2185 domain-containing protein [Kingella potus]STR00417.1 Protein of uncharacterised function (DUF2185) [Kingella potus]